VASREIRDVTIPDEGDYFPAALPVEAIRAYSVGRLPASWADGLVRRSRETEEDDGLRVRVAQVLIDGEWVPL
jgi:hypothetical protein